MLRPLLAIALLCLSSVASAGPRVGVVVTSHEGVAEARADEVAYDIAAAVATQIEGEAIAGNTVREQLPPGQVRDGCEDDPSCARRLAAVLQTDEVLLLNMHTAGKTLIVNCYRVPRDVTKPAYPQRPLRLMGGKAKKAQALMELATGLYPPGSVTVYVEPPPVKAPPSVVAPPKERGSEAAKGDQKASNKGSRTWMWVGIGGGLGAAAILGVVLGVALTTTQPPSAPSVTLP